MNNCYYELPLVLLLILAILTGVRWNLRAALFQSELINCRVLFQFCSICGALLFVQVFGQFWRKSHEGQRRLLFCVWVKCSINTHEVIWFTISAAISISLFIFSLSDLCIIGPKWVLKSPTTFMSVNM